MAEETRRTIGQLLLSAGVITQDELRQALEQQEKTGERLGMVLKELGHVKEDDILRALESQLGLPLVNLNEIAVDRSVLSKIPASFANRNNIFPVSEQDGVLSIAMSDPLDIHTLDDVRLLLGYEVEALIASAADIEKAIRKHYGVGADNMESMAVEQGSSGIETLDLDATSEDLEKMADDASIVRFVNQIILEAFHARATDIHIEPFEQDLRIRYRIDGLLQEQQTPPIIKRFQAPIVSRLKIMADLNIAEKRLPQDGRIRVRIAGEDLDLRISVIPTISGESINIRLLSGRSMFLGMEQLGLEAEDLARLKMLVEKPHGIILVTGPTGCGKTTTLYGALSHINVAGTKIITIEDPVEYQLYGANQIQVRPVIGLTFAQGLRSILRQDPDVIMVGEIRDAETADIAIRAALTGHLVLSTLHTNDAAGGVTRLLDMGVEAFLVSASVEGFIAQRLVRNICEDCKEPYAPGEEYLREIGFPLQADGVPPLSRGTGCEKCNRTGYRGRSALFETLLVSETLRKMIVQKSSTSEIRDEAIREGMKTVRQAGWERVRQGKTTIDEVLRVAEAM